MPKYIKNYQKQTFYWPKIRKIRRDVSDKPPHPSLSHPPHTHTGGALSQREKCHLSSKISVLWVPNFVETQKPSTRGLNAPRKALHNHANPPPQSIFTPIALYYRPLFWLFWGIIKVCLRDFWYISKYSCPIILFFFDIVNL